MIKQSGKNDNGKLNLSLSFDTWGAFTDFAANGETDMAESWQASRTSSSDWSGSTTFEDALHVAREGWPEGEKKTKAISHGLFSHVSHLIERQNVIYDIEGNGIDVAKFLNNEPECWQRFETELTEGPGHKLVRLVFNFAVSSGVSPAVIIARGAAMAALVELLEYAGHRVEITAAESIEHGNYSRPDYGELRVKVKEFSQNLDMGRVCFALAHPSMLRRIGFSVWERGCNGTERGALGIGGGYGRPTDLRSDKGDIYIGQALLGAVQWTNEKEAEAWVIEQLKAQGVNLHAVGAAS